MKGNNLRSDRTSVSLGNGARGDRWYGVAAGERTARGLNNYHHLFWKCKHIIGKNCVRKWLKKINDDDDEVFFAWCERESLRKTRETKLPLWELSWLIYIDNDDEKNFWSAGCYLRRGCRVVVIGRGVAPRVTTAAPQNKSWWWPQWWQWWWCWCWSNSLQRNTSHCSTCQRQSRCLTLLDPDMWSEAGVVSPNGQIKLLQLHLQKKIEIFTEKRMDNRLKIELNYVFIIHLTDFCCQNLLLNFCLY